MIRRAPRTAVDRALDAIYAEIPRIPACDGSCAASCGPIAMYQGEFDRLARAHGARPRIRQTMTCPLLSPTGACTAYTARPYICRLWGTTPALRCPRPECVPERWLSREEARTIHERVMEAAGPAVVTIEGKSARDLWAAIGLEAREVRAAIIEKAKEDARGR